MATNCSVAGNRIFECRFGPIRHSRFFAKKSAAGQLHFASRSATRGVSKDESSLLTREGARRIPSAFTWKPLKQFTTIGWQVCTCLSEIFSQNLPKPRYLQG